MLFQCFSNLKAISVNIHHCLRKTENSERLLREGIYFSCSFPNVFKTTMYCIKAGCFTTSISKYETHEKGKSLQKRIKKCSEEYAQVTSGFTAEKTCRYRCAVLNKENV